MTDDADRTPRLVRVLLIVAGIGLIGVVVMLFVKDSLPFGWSLLLFTMCMVLMLGGAYATAYVPDGPRNAYTQSGSGEESIPEFLPDEGGSARVRRAVVTSAFWLAFVVWVPCYAVPIAVLLRLFLADPDGDVDEAPFVISMVVGTIALAMYVVLGIFLSKWTVEGAHLRALRSALPKRLFGRTRRPRICPGWSRIPPPVFACASAGSYSRMSWSSTARSQSGARTRAG